ncbi:hypothetical protein H4217_007680 [Coemansia sp. RSA 1939]|nr:hypothetical protein H4217_007680 [Coemansia sp. RSA 1939]KAJ2607146.1 hypothetical protein EV177_005681 [Coemansia sp. RSA 1804]KAJ2691615.1 hypothetical protein GGH99_002285 [Coemansia sp. RSA 1285]
MIFSVSAIAPAFLALLALSNISLAAPIAEASAEPAPAANVAGADAPGHVHKRCGGCGGWGGCGGCGGWGGFGIPFASSFTNAVNANANAANFNDNTVYLNNKNANKCCNNLNTFTNANNVLI